MNLAPRSTSSPLLRHSSGKWVREGNIQLLQGQETLGLRPRKFGGKFGGKFGAESEEFRSTSPTFSRPTSEIYWPRHRGPGCPDADTLFYRISASSRNIFFSDARGIHARTPPSSFSLAARMRSSHTRKKCFFFALLSRKTRILPALLILQVVFALYVRPSNLRNLPSFFF